MQENYFLSAINSLKIKNCQGHDCIPLRILADETQFLLKPLSFLFNKIYESKVIPEQWLISKTMPIFKKRIPPKNLKSKIPFQTCAQPKKKLRN